MNSKAINELVFWFAITGWILNIISILGKVAYETNAIFLLPFFYIAFFGMGFALIICFANAFGFVIMIISIKSMRKEKHYLRNLLLIGSAVLVYPVIRISL
ncbi:hypothetical protein CN918_27985 [Priestia megaterium]|nr:hypothetical protein CN918_27985 [Priestia megaterium]